MIKPLVSIVLLFFCSFAIAEFDYESYQDKAIGNITASIENLLEEAKIEKNAIVVFPVPQKYFFTIKFSGKIVKINNNIESFFEQWATVGHGDKEFISLYSNALEVEYSGNTIFMPVQKNLESHLIKELKTGQELKVFAINVGWSSNSPVLLMTEFEAL